ncbi:acyl-CoA thioester hydrolase/BAAT C-terminal domain-containing protein [Oscillospiraceae bacterium 50-60]
MNRNAAYRVKTDGFHGDLFCPVRDAYPGKALICFSGSDGRFELTRMLAAVFQAHGLTVLALAYVMEEGLPDQFYHVPIDTLEAAAKRLHDMGYEKVGLWGISKGAELALTAGSLLPGSSWRFHGEELPYTSFGLKKFPLGHVLQKSLIARELTMYDLYLPVVQKPNPAAVIKAEKITGPVLLISSGMDTMWTSELAAEQVMDRLRQHSFPYFCQHLRYDYGGRLFVPVEFWMTKLFKGDRGQNREPGRKARMDSLTKTLEFVSQW